MRLAYQAFDRGGKSVASVIDAASVEEATEQLRRQGFYVTALKRADGEREAVPGASPALAGSSRLGMLGRGRRMKHLAMFTRQLYVLLCTGTPMVEALGALERQSRDAGWRAVIAELRREVEEGKSLSEAMDHHPACFDAVYRSLIRAGESGGKFEPILDRLSQLTRKQLQTRNAISGALVYPILLMGVSVVVLTAMLVFVLPRFGTLFETLNMPLPPTTRVMLMVSDALIGYWWAIVPGLIASVAGAVYWCHTPAGRRWLDVALIRVPLIRDATRSFITARIIRLIGVLSDSYVPLLDALDLAKQAANHSAYRDLMTRAQDAVSRGEPISTAFRDDRLISPTVYEAIRSGEQTGKVSSLMLNMADFLDEENEVLLKAVTSIIEPIILIGLGVLVGLLAVSMFMPLFDLTAQAGG
jgi:type II secretory pathway component PulF